MNSATSSKTFITDHFLLFSQDGFSISFGTILYCGCFGHQGLLRAAENLLKRFLWAIIPKSKNQRVKKILKVKMTNSHTQKIWIWIRTTQILHCLLEVQTKTCKMDWSSSQNLLDSPDIPRLQSSWSIPHQTRYSIRNLEESPLNSWRLQSHWYQISIMFLGTSIRVMIVALTETVTHVQWYPQMH